MSNAIFHYVERRTRDILNTVREVESDVPFLASLRTYETMPVAQLKEAADRLEETAKALRECADKAPKPIKENA